MEKEIRLTGSNLITVESCTKELKDFIDYFQKKIKVKLDLLFSPITLSGFGDISECEIPMHNLKRNIESLELYADMAKMLVENMESDLKNIAITQATHKIKSDKIIRDEILEQRIKEKREKDRKRIYKKRHEKNVALEE